MPVITFGVTLLFYTHLQYIVKTTAACKVLHSIHIDEV